VTRLIQACGSLRSSSIGVGPSRCANQRVSAPAVPYMAEPCARHNRHAPSQVESCATRADPPINSGRTLRFPPAGAGAEFIPDALDLRHPFLGLRDPAGQLRCLSDPARHELLVEPVALVNVEVARVLVLGRDWRDRTQRRAAEERHLDVPREAMDAEE